MEKVKKEEKEERENKKIERKGGRRGKEMMEKDRAQELKRERQRTTPAEKEEE